MTISVYSTTPEDTHIDADVTFSLENRKWSDALPHLTSILRHATYQIDQELEAEILQLVEQKRVEKLEKLRYEYLRDLK
jgi:hypothetical protein